MAGRHSRKAAADDQALRSKPPSNPGLLLSANGGLRRYLAVRARLGERRLTITLCGRSSALAASRNTPPRITLLRRRRVPISAPAPGAVVLVSCPIASITRCQIAAPTASPSAAMVVTGTGGVIRPPNAVADQSVWLAPDCVLRASAVLRAAVPAAHRQTSPECRAAT
jgi:hypothetical protein